MNGSNCPLPNTSSERVLMAHGGGGRLMRHLIGDLLAPALAQPDLDVRHDAALLALPGRARALAFTTDSYVVQPLFFSGGDIGSLAVNGTVNDLAMRGARPLYLSCALILEEGLALEDLRRVASSMGAAARAAGVALVTGDTKVVERGKGDGLFVNTAGIGVLEHDLRLGPAQVRAGDRVLVSGDLGRHGIAILSARESLGFETSLASDCAALWPAVQALLAAGIELHCLRDLTRGGLGAALNEIALDAGVALSLDEAAVPVGPEVSSACELLGLDPFYVANEGRFVAFVAAHDAARALELLRAQAVSTGAALIGEVRPGPAGLVSVRTCLGSARVLDLPSGEQLPRIC
jgi:hydrogenase expression/formation protein HypE